MLLQEDTACFTLIIMNPTDEFPLHEIPVVAVSVKFVSLLLVCICLLLSFTFLPIHIFVPISLLSLSSSVSPSLSAGVCPSLSLSILFVVISFGFSPQPLALCPCSVCLSPGGPESAGECYVCGGAGGLHHPPLAGQHTARRPVPLLHRRGAQVSGQKDGRLPSAAHPGRDTPDPSGMKALSLFFVSHL